MDNREGPSSASSQLDDSRPSRVVVRFVARRTGSVRPTVAHHVADGVAIAHRVDAQPSDELADLKLDLRHRVHDTTLDRS